MDQLFEEWIDHFENKIPVQNYTIKLKFGEENGLVIRLYGEQYEVIIDFGVVEAINVLDEGVQLNDPWDCSSDRMPDNGFASTIYMIKNGRYLRYIEACLGSDLSSTLYLKQYNIVALNYVVMVVGRYDPIITVSQIKP